MSQYLDIPKTVVLLVDGSANQRSYWSDELKRCSADYEILEASDRQSTMDLYRSRRIDCVVLDLGLPDQSGLTTLAELVPLASRPRVAVIVLTRMTECSVGELVRKNGAHDCFLKYRTSGEDLDKAIQRAITFVGQMPKEDRYRLFERDALRICGPSTPSTLL